MRNSPLPHRLLIRRAALDKLNTMLTKGLFRPIAALKQGDAIEEIGCGTVGVVQPRILGDNLRCLLLGGIGFTQEICKLNWGKVTAPLFGKPSR